MRTESGQAPGCVIAVDDENIPNSPARHFGCCGKSCGTGTDDNYCWITHHSFCFF
jgi:hypothetical protein